MQQNNDHFFKNALLVSDACHPITGCAATSARTADTSLPRRLGFKKKQQAQQANQQKERKKKRGVGVGAGRSGCSDDGNGNKAPTLHSIFFFLKNL
jgi:hypothetical protein